MKNLYHGSSILFDKFSEKGLGYESGVMAVTSGFYFTTSLMEAVGYGFGKNKKDCYLYSLKIEDENGFCHLKKDNSIITEMKVEFSLEKIKNILKKAKYYEEKILDFYDVDIEDEEEVEEGLLKIAEIYKNLLDEDILFGLNNLGNDWFSEDNEAIYELNKNFAKEFGIKGFIKHISDDNIHYVFLDYEEINKNLKVNIIPFKEDIILEEIYEILNRETKTVLLRKGF